MERRFQKVGEDTVFNSLKMVKTHHRVSQFMWKRRLESLGRPSQEIVHKALSNGENGGVAGS